MSTTEETLIRQRPEWPDEHLLQSVSSNLRGRDGLVSIDDVLQLRQLVADASSGRALMLQYGDCAEPVLDEPADYVASFLSLRDAIHQAASALSSRPIVHIGRIAGQYAKPRSSDYEDVDGVAMYAYRGDMVNSAEPDHRLRVPDPRRLLRAHDCATKVMHGLLGAASARNLTNRLVKGSRRPSGEQISTGVYTSHEALILEYEMPFVRKDERMQVTFSSNAHMLWVGDRTRSVESAHVALLGEICNPVGIKVGPSVQVDELVSVVERLNPTNAPGRVTLIVRLGVQEVGRTLPHVMREFKKRGTRVAWMCDPMHGNTRRLADGRKVRWMPDVLSEIRCFAETASAFDLPVAGLHLEASASAVGECLDGAIDRPILPRGRELKQQATKCDPRLSPYQAVQAVEQMLLHMDDIDDVRPGNSVSRNPITIQS